MKNRSQDEIAQAMREIRNKFAKSSGCTKDKDYAGCHACPHLDTCQKDIMTNNLTYCTICQKAMLNSEPELIRKGNLCITCYDQLQESKMKP